LDAKYLNEVPFIFKPLEPAMNIIKDLILSAHGLVGIPWWAVLFASSFVIRLTIMPLILIQMKRISKIAPIAPVFVFIKDTWKHSDLTFFKKSVLIQKIYQ